MLLSPSGLDPDEVVAVGIPGGTRGGQRAQGEQSIIRRGVNSGRIRKGGGCDENVGRGQFRGGRKVWAK